MTHEYEVTIGIPVFNGAQTVARTIESALAQKHPALEVILVDNASTDNTLEVADAYRSQGLTVYRNDENIGFNRNFNRVIELAKGRYLLILSADDLLIRPDAIKLLATELERHPTAALVFSAVELIDADGRKIGEQHAQLQAGLIGRDTFLEMMLVRTYPISLNTALFRRALLQKHGGFDERFVNSDMLLISRLLSEADIVYSDKLLGAYRIVDSSTGNRLLYGQPDLLSRKMALIDALFDYLGADYRHLYKAGVTRWLKYTENMIIPARIKNGHRKACALAADIVRNRPGRMIHPRFILIFCSAMLLPKRLLKSLFELAARLLGKQGTAVKRALD